MMNKCMVILNPSSGKEQAMSYEEAIRAQLADYEVIVKETTGEGDAKRFAREACDERYEAVVLVGGDGTLNEGINGIAEQAHRPTVGIVPLGTVNDFARALNISLEPEEAIRLLGGNTRRADIGKVNNHYFTNVVAIGRLGEAVGDVSVEQKTAMGSFAYLLEGVKALAQNDSFEVSVQHGDVLYREEATLFLSVLTNSVGSFERITEDADVSDGLIHCFIIKNGSLFDLAKLAKNLLMGNYEQDENIITFDAKTVTVQTSKEIGLNVDGDLVGMTPAMISILHNHLTFFVE